MGFRIAIINILCNVGKELAADTIGAFVKDHQIDGHIIFQQKVADGVHGNAQCLILGIAVYARGYEGKSHGFTPGLFCQLQSPLIAGSKERLLIFMPFLPAWTYSVDDILAGKPVSQCQLCTAGGAAPQGLTGLQQFRSCRPMDTTIHTTVPLQGGIGRIYYGVHLHFGNVISHDLNRHIITCFCFGILHRYLHYTIPVLDCQYTFHFSQRHKIINKC